MSLLKPYKGEPPTQPIQEEPSEFDEQEEILIPDEIVGHKDKQLRNGKVVRTYLVKFKNYPLEDAQWMQETQLKDVLALLSAYNSLYQMIDPI